MRSKFALWFIAAILLIAALLFSLGHYRKQSVRSAGGDKIDPPNRPTAVASSSETPTGGGGDSRNSIRMSKADAAAQAKSLAARFIPLAAKSGSGGRPGPDDEAEMVSLLEEISHFNRNQMKSLIGEVRESPDMDDDAKADGCGFLLTVMADIDPFGTLDLLSELQPLFGGKQERAVSVIKPLEAVADSQAPMAADWLLAHPDLFGHPMQLEAAKCRIVEGAARSDPALAFALMDQMKVTSTAQAMSDMVRSAHTNDERLALLTAARKKAATMDDPAAAEKLRKDMLSAIGTAMSRDPADKTEDFIKSAALDDSERALLMQGHPEPGY